jgi:hypothetical protein
MFEDYYKIVKVYDIVRSESRLVPFAKPAILIIAVTNRLQKQWFA